MVRLMVIELADDEHVTMGERPLGVCYATTFVMREQTIGIALAVPRGDGAVSVHIHTTPAGVNLKPCLEALAKSVAVDARRALGVYNER